MGCLPSVLPLPRSLPSLSPPPRCSPLIASAQCLCSPFSPFRHCSANFLPSAVHPASSKARRAAGGAWCAGADESARVERSNAGERVSVLNAGEESVQSVSGDARGGENGRYGRREIGVIRGELEADGDEVEEEGREGDDGDIKGKAWQNALEIKGQESYGEVSRILSSVAVEGEMFYMIEWKDGHEPSWLPAAAVARDVLAEYESPWWKAIRSADEGKLRELIGNGLRDVDAIDENGRTALLFAAGLGSDKCVRLLVEAGANVNGQDLEGFTALHIAAGYIKPNVVTVLMELGVDPDIRDSKGRTALKLVQELLEKIPTANPLQFARRLALENISKLLEDAIYENAEVQQILEKRPRVEGGFEYLVKWKDGSGEEWLPAESVGEDLVQDYEAGLEYAIAEKILDKKEENGQVVYLVKWVDIDNPTWEPLQNVVVELVAEYENVPAQEVERRQKQQGNLEK